MRGRGGRGGSGDDGVKDSHNGRVTLTCYSSVVWMTESRQLVIETNRAGVLVPDICTQPLTPPLTFVYLRPSGDTLSPATARVVDMSDTATLAP